MRMTKNHGDLITEYGYISAGHQVLKTESKIAFSLHHRLKRPSLLIKFSNIEKLGKACVWGYAVGLDFTHVELHMLNCHALTDCLLQTQSRPLCYKPS